MRQYTMNDSLIVAKKASADIECYLRKNSETLNVINVENDPEYQGKDIDLIWITHDKTLTIEVKGDRWDNTGNFFFETLSNKEKGTPGCFIYSQADLLYYYFTRIKVLYCIPMIESRKWFLSNINRFKERETHTPIGNGFYTTVGRLVPINALLNEVTNIEKYQIK